jgi:hypothetical protein
MGCNLRLLTECAKVNAESILHYSLYFKGRLAKQRCCKNKVAESGDVVIRF